MTTEKLAILILAFLTEALVEYFARPILKPPATPRARSAGRGKPSDDGQPPVPILEEYPFLRYAAAAVGILLCLAYRVDLLALFGLSAFAPWVGCVITGLVAARGANFIHDFAARWLT